MSTDLYRQHEENHRDIMQTAVLGELIERLGELGVDSFTPDCLLNEWRSNINGAVDAAIMNGTDFVSDQVRKLAQKIADTMGDFAANGASVGGTNAAGTLPKNIVPIPRRAKRLDSIPTPHVRAKRRR